MTCPKCWGNGFYYGVSATMRLCCNLCKGWGFVFSDITLEISEKFEVKE